MSIRLEQLQVGAKIIGLIEGEAATILNATLRGVSTVELIYKGPSGSLEMSWLPVPMRIVFR